MQGGKTTLENEAAVCSICHALIHAGLLGVRGTAGAQLNWEQPRVRFPRSDAPTRPSNRPSSPRSARYSSDRPRIPSAPNSSVVRQRFFRHRPPSAVPASRTAAESTARRSAEFTSRQSEETNRVRRWTESTRVDWLRRHGQRLDHGQGQLGLSRTEARDRVCNAVASMPGGWTETEVLRRALTGGTATNRSTR